jgi:hypothetical protein
MRCRSENWEQIPNSGGSVRLFSGWSGRRLAAVLRGWNVTAELDKISCPALALQDVRGQYGTRNSSVKSCAMSCRPGCRSLATAAMFLTTVNPEHRQRQCCVSLPARPARFKAENAIS